MNQKKSSREIRIDIAKGYCPIPFNILNFQWQYDVPYEWKIQYWGASQWVDNGNEFTKGLVLDNIVPVSFGRENAIPWYIIADISNLQLISPGAQISKKDNLDPFTLGTLHKLAVKFDLSIIRRDSELKALVDAKREMQQKKFKEAVLDGAEY